jgi:hypothetical protein
MKAKKAPLSGLFFIWLILNLKNPVPNPVPILKTKNPTT